MPVRFNAKIGEDGEVELDIHAFRMTPKTRFVDDHQNNDDDGVPEFDLVGTTKDGLRFESRSLSFTHLGQRWSRISDWHRSKPLGECGKVLFTRNLEQPVEKTFLKLHLKGFECFRGHSVSHALGKVAVAGTTKLEEFDKLAGYIVVEAEQTPPDSATWKRDAEALVEHIRSILSLGSSTSLHAPILEFAHDSLHEIEVLSQTRQHPPEMRVIHKLEQKSLLNAAVATWPNPLMPVNELPFAIEWFTMNSVYNEVRLVCAMTALENLVDSNLADDEAFIQSRSAFDKMKRAMRKLVGEWLTASLEGAAADEARGEIADKLLDLNRRPFRRKLELLAKRWNVSLEGITDEQIAGAIRARNAVVHSGQYRPSASGGDLWDHMTVARELVVRFLLTVIGFRGIYLSHLGGYHRAEFPPKPATVNGGSEGAQ